MVRKLTLAIVLSLSVCGATTVKFTSVPSSSDYGTYNGFSIATVAGIPYQLLMCDDPVHTTTMPSDEITYDVIRFDGVHTEGFMYAARGLVVYQEAAVLLSQFVNLGGMSLPASTIADYQYAIWHLMVTGNPATQTAGETALQTAALSIVQNSTFAELAPIYSSMLVYTPVKTGDPLAYRNQEFLQYSPTPIPEPGTLWLLACALGMGGVVMGFRRLRRPAR